MKKNEYGDWQLAYLNYDLNILDDMAVLAVISFLSEDMSIRVFNLVVELSESRKFSRTKRIFAINTLYEQAISKGFTIKACILPHEQTRAFSLFCNLHHCYKDSVGMEKLFQQALDQTYRPQQQQDFLYFYSVVALEWLRLFWRLQIEMESKPSTITDRYNDNLYLVSKKWKIKQPVTGYLETFETFYWRDSRCFGNTDDLGCENLN